MGLLFNASELPYLVDRYNNGPLKSLGDSFAYSPAAGDQCSAAAALLVSDSVNEYWDGDLIQQAAPNEAGYKGHYLLAAAFHYLMTGNATYGNKARTVILTQIANSNPVWENYYATSASSVLNTFIMAGFLIRMIKAFEYTRDLWSASEISSFETYIDRAVPVFLNVGECYIKNQFPNRLSRDYSVLSGYAASGQTYGGYLDTDDRSWTHKDASGNWHNRIYRIHADYSNQTGISMLLYGLWAIYKNDATKIDRAKIFFEEMIRFGLYEDGTFAEYNRNHTSGDAFPALGTMWYSTISYECYLIFADALRRTGDNSLLEFETDQYLWYRPLEADTVQQWHTGTTKSIKTALNALITNIDGSTPRYFKSVTNDFKLDTLNYTTYRWKPEVIFGIAAKCFGDQAYIDTHNLVNAENSYNYASGPQWNSNAVWRGGTGTYAALPLELYGLYGVGDYVARTINKKMLL